MSSSPSRFDLLAQFTLLFDAEAVRHGRALAAAGASEILRTLRTAQEIYLEAEVQDEESMPWRSEVWLDLDEGGAVSNLVSRCSCVAGEDCAHVVATVLAFQRNWHDESASAEVVIEEAHDKAPTLPPGEAIAAQASATGQAAAPALAALLGLMPASLPRPRATAPRRERKTAPPEPSPPQSTPATLAWLESLGQAGGEPTVDAASEDERPRGIRKRMVYLLHLGVRTRLSLGQCRVLQNGRLGKPVPCQVFADSLRRGGRAGGLFASEDILPIRLYLGMQDTAGYQSPAEGVAVEGEAGALLLKAALSTGRLYVRGMMQEPLRAGPARPVVARWLVDRQGQQRLSLVESGSLRPVLVQPPLVLDTAAGVLGELTMPWPTSLLPALMQAPPLNEPDALLVRERLERLGQTHHCELPLPAVAEPQAAGRPQARLLLGLAQFRHHAVTSLSDEHAVAELFFDYPNRLSVIGAQSPPALAGRWDEGRWCNWRRDLAAEARVWALVAAEGLASYPQRLGGYLRLGSDNDCLMPARSTAAGWLPFLDEGVRRLRAAGIAVDIDESFPYRLEEAEDWFVKVEEEPGSAWFDLDLGVTIHGERVSLVPALLQLIRQHPLASEFLHGLDESRSYPLALDDRRVLAVPVPRLKAWLLPLLDFVDGERPRLSRQHAGLLAGLEDGRTRWQGGDELRALARRLKDFTGITQTPPAAGFTAELRPYQQAGLDWLQFLREYGLAGILADDMGLGKTVQTLAHLHLEKVSGRAERPSLVVATTSLMSNWREEAARFAPELKVLTLHGKDRAARFDEIDAADVVLTTYPLLVRDRETLLARQFHVLVLDEAQFIKNPKAQSHQVARQLQARHRLSLTGTPLENHLGELWAQFDFLMPGFLGGTAHFGRFFRAPIEKLSDEATRARLAERVRPFLLRRTKEDVLTDLPPRSEIVRWVEIEGGQRDLYESLRVAFDRKLRAALDEQGVGRSQIMILDALLKLRQVCCDPRLVKLPSAQALVKSGSAGSAKLSAAIEMIEELIDEGRRILVFSQFTSMLALLREELDARQITYSVLTGQTVDRETPIRDFQEGRVPLFLISLKAGGTGLNLTAADTVIHYDPWWNPAVEEQATARAHRIGQDKPVFVYKLLTQGTVEEKILALQARKRGLADQFVGQGAGMSGSGQAHLLSAADLDVLFEPLSS